MTQALSEYASVSGESINILSVTVYRNQALYSSNILYGIVHVNTCATLPCGINRKIISNKPRVKLHSARHVPTLKIMTPINMKSISSVAGPFSSVSKQNEGHPAKVY